MWDKLSLIHCNFKSNNIYIEKNILEIAEIKYGKSISTSDILNDGMYPVYGSNGIIGFLDNYIFENHKVAISCRGNSSGVIHLTEKQSTITSNSLVLDFSNIDFTFYFYLEFVNKGLYEYKTGSAQPQITIDNLKKLNLLIPDDIKKYNELVKVNIDYIYKLKNENIKLNNLKQLYLKKFFG